ncbi:MAG: ABC transporter ATP-binding protein [Acidovorax sp.]|uniref:ABC transporter ATP-binding protein n=1 Tax=Acidovorax sp. TaxID=1872122 RepID=UPI003919090D
MSTLLEVNNLSRHFGGLKALDGLSLNVSAGEIVGLIGPNGAGKTTAVNVMSGTMAPSGGKVLFAGEDVTSYRAHERSRRGLVRTFQHTSLYFGRTVRENAQRATYLQRYPGIVRSLFPSRDTLMQIEQADLRADQLLSMFDLGHVADFKCEDLSYGFQKILGIVLALAARPKVVLLDEPVAGLSAAETDRVRDVIRKVRDGGTGVMVIEHNMRFIAGLCDHVVVMAAGQFLAHGTPKEVLSDSKVIEAYLGRSQDDVEN